MDKDDSMPAKTDRKQPRLVVVSDKRLIDLLAETECCEFEETLRNTTFSPPKTETPEQKSCIEESPVEVARTSTFECPIEDADREDICNDADWCWLSLFRLKAQASEYRACNLNFSFHIALITHKILNIYEDEEETDLHDFLNKEDLRIMARHQNDDDQQFSLIFQPNYEIRPNCKRVASKIDEYVNTYHMRFGVDATEDSDFFADSWTKSPFHGVCKTENPKNAKKANRSKK